MIVIWTRPAIRDMRHIRAYIARDAPGNAAVVARRLRGAAESLRDYPGRGRPGRSPHTRELVVPRTPYVVAYRLSGEAVFILRVLHGARRWPSE